MKKQVIAALFAALLSITAVVSPVRADYGYYPISVDEYTENGAPHIRKVYQLALTESPSLIPTDDFERDGYQYSLLDITQKNEVAVHTKEHSETVTQDSDTGDMSTILKRLDAQKEAATEDGYAGVLVLDHTSIEVKVKGYKTSTKNVSAKRTYRDLSDADLSLIPKSINDNGRTLTLGDVQWVTDYGEGDAPHYTANASYTGTATNRYATGYTVTATYTGTVAKMECEVITYTAIFSGEKIPDQLSEADEPQPTAVTEQEQESEPGQEPEPEPERKPEQEPEQSVKETEAEAEDAGQETVEETANTATESGAESLTPAEDESNEHPDEPSTRKPVDFLAVLSSFGGVYAIVQGVAWCGRKIKEEVERSYQR